MFATIYKIRFELFFSTQLMILFGSLFVPHDFHENVLMPFLFILNLSAGIVLLSKQKKLMWLAIILLSLAIFIFGKSFLLREGGENALWRLMTYFVFYIMVTVSTIQQVWTERKINSNLIFGLMSGYISLGILAFCLFLSIEVLEPHSFTGYILETADENLRVDAIMYYAYITLLTIGYGEIVPVTPVAQKAAILVGLAGQFYLVIVTAVVIEKYIRMRHLKDS